MLSALPSDAPAPQGARARVLRSSSWVVIEVDRRSEADLLAALLIRAKGLSVFLAQPEGLGTGYD